MQQKKPIHYQIGFFLFLLVVCLKTQITAATPYLESKPYDEAISLGSACQVAWQLETNGLRRNAYPFDWMVTPFEGLISFLVHRGAFFLDADKLEVMHEVPGNPSLLVVRDCVYNIQMNHDFFGQSIADSYASVYAKYKRRIARLFDLLEASNKRILFMRVGLDYHQAIMLDNILQTLFPKLSYTLVAVNDNIHSQQDWGLPRIRNFYMPQTPDNWAGDYAIWKDILSQFTFTPDKRSKRERNKIEW